MGQDSSRISPKHSQRSIWLWIAFATISFWILDSYSISLGDDFAYMFTDSRTHALDGKKVSTFADCLHTQVRHFSSTNGRFLVHLTDMMIINLMPESIYRILNAAMFALLYVGILTLGFIPPRRSYFAAITLGLIWWTIPDVATILLSLVSYSLNYLWTAAAIILLLQIRKYRHKISKLLFAALSLYALICGSLQESFSIPLCIAIAVDSIIRYKNLSRREILLRLSFLVGSAILICAPGNYAHFLSGGAMGRASLLHKLTSTFQTLLFSPISLLTAMLVIMSFRSPYKCKRFVKKNTFLLSAIVGAIMFACVTFTAPRQLFAPSVFALIILCRAIDNHRHILNNRSKLINISLLISLSIFFAAVAPLRSIVKANHNSYIANISTTDPSLTYSNVDKSPYNTHPLLWKILGNYAPDPWEGSHFSFPFDSYSRRGLSRTLFLNADQIKAVFPYPVESIKRQCPPLTVKSDSIYPVYPLDKVYSAATIYGPPPTKVKTSKGTGARFEQFYTTDSIEIIVVPSSVKNIKIIYPSHKP